MEEQNVNIWLVNTGWTGGPHGVGSRMKLKHTRAMISAAMEGKLDHVSFTPHPVFGILVPDSCPDVPNELLDPKNTWTDKAGYDKKATHLAAEFARNFAQYEEYANEEIRSGGPNVLSS